MAVYLVENLDGKHAWYLNGEIDYNGYGKFLFRNGTYKKCHYTDASQMTEDEALESFRLLNSRLRYPIKSFDYYID